MKKLISSFAFLTVIFTSTSFAQTSTVQCAFSNGSRGSLQLTAEIDLATGFGKITPLTEDADPVVAEISAATRAKTTLKWSELITDSRGTYARWDLRLTHFRSNDTGLLSGAAGGFTNKISLRGRCSEAGS